MPVRLLCLHGWRTSGSIMQDQLAMALWQKNLTGVAELIFIDAPHAAKGTLQASFLPLHVSPTVAVFHRSCSECCD